MLRLSQSGANPGLSPDTELRDVSDLVLAENTTNMGKASQSLSEAFAKMPKNVKFGDELDKSVADFSRQIAELKTQAIDELSETDNGSMGFSEYRDTIISGFNDNVGDFSSDKSKSLMFHLLIIFLLTMFWRRISLIPQQTNDTIVNDDIRTEFADLESVLEVYQYIKNN